MDSTGNVSLETAAAPARAVADLADDEIVDAVASLFGVDGFDAEGDEQGWCDLADLLEVGSLDDDTFDALQERVSGLAPRRFREVGCSWLGLTWEEWARRLVGKSEAEIARLLAGGAGSPCAHAGVIIGICSACGADVGRVG